jgi:hypothetical protein
MFTVKKEEPTITKTFRFPKSLLNKLDRVAEANGISANNLLKQMAEYVLTEMDKAGTKKGRLGK